MQVWRIIKTQIALRGIYVVHTDRCEMCPLPIHTKFYLSTLRTWREKNRQTALSDHLLTYITFFMIILTWKIFHFHIQVYAMCVSMSVRGIFEFDQPVNSVSRLNWEKYKFQNYIGHRKIHSTKKNTLYIIVIISLMNYLMNWTILCITIFKTEEEVVVFFDDDEITNSV